MQLSAFSARDRIATAMCCAVLWTTPFCVLHTQTPAGTDTTTPCRPVAPPEPPSDAQRQDARDLAERARRASMVGGATTARDLFKRAAALDPTDPTTAYALARLYDAAKEPRSAISEYCRFLALAPEAPEAQDVKQRIVAIAIDAARVRVEAAPHVVVRHVHPTTRPSQAADNDNRVFVLATIMPGLGQYYTNRPLFGALVTATSLGALYWGLRMRPATHDRPNLAPGLTLAIGTSVLAATEAYLHTHPHAPSRKH